MRAPAAAYEVIIIGAGPAGLSAALVLGRACRRVLLCDDGTPRSWASKALYGFVTRDGTDPSEFRRLAREELGRYRNVSTLNAHVTAARRLTEGGFEVRARRARFRSRKLLIATGVEDHLPKIRGIERYFGTSIFQCPYCDGWELRDAPVAVYGKGPQGLEIARAVTAWTRDLALCTNGESGLTRAARRQLQHNQVRLHEQRISGLEGVDGQLQNIVFADGSSLAREALFFETPSTGRSSLAASLGCELDRKGDIHCGGHGATSVPGVFAAGNIIRDVQLSIVAAAEGARAAFGINRALTREDFDRNARSPHFRSSRRRGAPERNGRRS